MNEETQDLERQLARALHAEVDGVEPDPGALRLIRRRIEEETPMRNRYRAPLIAAVAASAVAIGAVVAVAQQDPPEPPVGPAPTVTTPAPSPVTPTPSPTPSPARTPSSGTSSAPAPSTSAATATGTIPGVPVYALTLQGDDNRLVREFRTVPARGDRVHSAISALALAPADPDYATVWRRPSRLSVRVAPNGITVDLSPDAFAATGVGTARAEASIQQLVWTATAAAGRDVPVTVLVDGQRGYDAWRVFSLGDPTRRDPDLRAPVWIDAPAEGATLAPGSQRITGQGSGFEATFSYRVTSGSREVDRGVVQGREEGGAGWWTFDIALRLPAGSYLVTVEPDNPATGPDARPARFDTKRFTVRR